MNTPESTEGYKQLITRDFPQFGVTSIRYLGSGWDNAAVLVNDKYVFRFLRGIFDQKFPLKTYEIEKEINILDFLQGKVSFAVPKPDFVAPDHSYFGYQLIAGTLWDQAGDDQLSEEYLRGWVGVRSEISKAIRPEQAGELKVPSYRTANNERLVNEFIVDQAADPRVKEMAKAAMNYVCSRCATKNDWVFIHEDLQMSNCMVDPTTKKITGVIDWLEAEVGPVEAEFYFWSKFGGGVLEKVAKYQEEFDGTKVDIKLAEAIHQFYIVADYQDYKSRGFIEAAQHKWRQIEAYLDES